jgi:hypothetical protein
VRIARDALERAAHFVLGAGLRMRAEFRERARPRFRAGRDFFFDEIEIGARV